MPEPRRLRILWIKAGGLWPPDRGGRLRSFHLLAQLARRHRITLLTTHGPEDDSSQLAARLPDGTRIVSLPHQPPKRGTPGFALAVLRCWSAGRPADVFKFRLPELRREARRLAEGAGFDLCVADFLSATALLPWLGDCPVLLFEHNVEHLIWRRLAQVDPSAWRRLLLTIEARLLRRHEARSVARASLTVAVSEIDRARLLGLAPGAIVATIPTGVDTTWFAPQEGRAAAHHLAFLGSMDWHPNEDAVLHFLGAVLPRIQAVVPDLSMSVIGRNPSPRLRAAAAEAGCEVTGTVDDVRPHLARAAVVVVPLRVGGGTRLKILEALAMGKAVVSTAIGAEGLPLEPGRHFVQADGDEHFAREVAALLDDPTRRERLGAEGRRLVASRHEWAAAADALEEHCFTAIDLDRGGPGFAGDAVERRREVRRLLKTRLLNHVRAWLHLSRGGRALYARGQASRAMRAWRTGREAIPPDARSILFVCQGNIIRSPMAAALMCSALARLGPDAPRIASAGLRAETGRPADERAVRVASRVGVNLAGHRARRLTDAQVDAADRIVAMDTLVEAELLARFPQAAGRIALLTAGDGANGLREVEILDPYDGDERDIRRCYEKLRAVVRRQAKGIGPPARRCDGLEARHAY